MPAVAGSSGRACSTARRSPRPRRAKHDLRGPDRPARTGRRGPNRAPGTRSPCRTSTSRACPRGHALLGPDAPRELVLDAEALETPEAIRRWVEGAYAYWVGDGVAASRSAPAGVRLLDELLAPRGRSTAWCAGTSRTTGRLLVASREQARLDHDRSLRRVEVVGPAGSGKSMLAAEKAAGGWPARATGRSSSASTSASRRPILRELEATRPRPGGRPTPHVRRSTACARASAARWRPPGRPEPDPPRDWWDETLPHALETAIDALPDDRYHAVVVDEGQDFEARWLELLTFLLVDPAATSSGSSTTPARRSSGTTSWPGWASSAIELFENHRNPESVAELAGRFYRGGEAVFALARTGRRPRDHRAEPGDRRSRRSAELHRLIEDERVPPWQIVVLSGVSATDSDAWRRRRFGNAVLWNCAIDDGSSHGTCPRGGPGRARRGPVRDDPPLQGPGARGRRPRRAARPRTASTSSSTSASPARRPSSS